MVVLTNTVRTARKQHRCAQCATMIVRGERYRCQVSTDDGLHDYKAHDECDRAAAQYDRFLNEWDDYPILCEVIEPSDHEWLVKDFPEVAVRLKILDAPTPW